MPSDHYNSIYSKEKSPFGDKPSGFVSKITEIIKNGNVIDLGAGQGRNSLYLARNGFKVLAIDNSETALELIQKSALEEKLDIETSSADLSKDLPDIQKYDAIIISFVLHHLSKERASELISQIQKNSKSGCIHIISTFTSEGDFYKLPQSKSRFYSEPGELKEIYKNWEVLFYDEKIGNAHQEKEDGTKMQNLTAHILARKP